MKTSESMQIAVDICRSRRIGAHLSLGYLIVAVILTECAGSNELQSLCYNVQTGNGKTVDDFIRNGHDPDSVCTHELGERTLITKAAMYGHHNIILTLLLAGAKVDPLDRAGSSPLFYASQGGWLKSVNALLKHGHAHPDGLSYEGGPPTPLLEACKANLTDVAEVLLEHGADPSLSDSLGQTPLMWAAHEENVQLVQMLIDKGAVVTALNKQGQSALLTAATENKYIQVTEILLAAGADVDQAALDGTTPLMSASNYNTNLGIVDALLEGGADTFIADKDGRTALHFAAYSGFEGAARALLRNGGSDISAQMVNGWTAEELAVERGHKKTAQTIGLARIRRTRGRGNGPREVEEL